LLFLREKANSGREEEREERVSEGGRDRRMEGERERMNLPLCLPPSNFFFCPGD
jgi:hypothetical protein